MPRRAPIIRRLDAALDKMRAQGMAVRAIYLTADDWDAFNDARSKEYGTPLVAFQYLGVEIRSGQTSTIYSTHGVGLSVPRRA